MITRKQREKTKEKIVNYKNKNCLEADVPDFLFIGQILKQKS